MPPIPLTDEFLVSVSVPGSFLPEELTLLLGHMVFQIL